MTILVYKMGDTSPSINSRLINPNTGSSIDLTGATSVFHMLTNDSNRTFKISGAAATIPSPASTGSLIYNWASGNTSQSGLFIGYFVTTQSDGTIITSPADDSLIISINRP